MLDWGETDSMAEERAQRRLAAILATDVVGQAIGCIADIAISDEIQREWATGHSVLGKHGKWSK